MLISVKLIKIRFLVFFFVFSILTNRKVMMISRDLDLFMCVKMIVDVGIGI